MQERNCLIISGSSGIGMTTLANKYSDDIIEIESDKFEYIAYDNSNDDCQGIEIANRYQNKQWPWNYIAEIIQKSREYGIVLITQDKMVRNKLKEEGLKYVACFSDSTNDEDLTSENCKLVLENGEYLEDALCRVGVIQKPVSRTRK